HDAAERLSQKSPEHKPSLTMLQIFRLTQVIRMRFMRLYVSTDGPKLHGKESRCQLQRAFHHLFLYDMCPLLGNLKNAAQCATLLRAFLAGYRSIRPLEPDHEAHIDMFTAARHATTICEQQACSGTGACRPKIWLGTL